jgi:predicted ribosome quality control (RQC) complex YloA/Tae2 family protein
MLSLTELKRAGTILQGQLADCVLQRAIQLDEFNLVLTFHNSQTNPVVLLSCHPEFGRVSLLPAAPKAAATPPSFSQYLRAHLMRAALESVRVSDNERQLHFLLRGREEHFELVLSLLAARSNVYLLDGRRHLVHAMRPLEDTRRELNLGAAWTEPAGGARSGGADRWPDLENEEYLEAVEAEYQRIEGEQAVANLGRRLEQAFSREAAFLERKASNLRDDLNEAHRADEYRRKGELLKSVLHTVRPGSSRVEAADFGTGETVEIAIDPKLSPGENLEAYFRKYQKELRGAGAIEQQLSEVHAARQSLESIRDRLQGILSAVDPRLQDLEALASQPRVRRLLLRKVRKPAPPAPSVKKAATVPGRLLPRRYKSESGWEIWVGRTDEGNDYLTMKLARGNDLFFHLEGYPGSHVVLRTEGRPDPPADAMLDACELAVHFSKMKAATRADVHVAPVKNINKPKGAKPGLVYVRKGRTIHLRRDPKRLQAILASRIDE